MLRGILVTFWLACACGSSEESCTWGVDELLKANRLPVEKRKDCGAVFYGYAEGIADGVACLQSALDADVAAQFAVNECADCSIWATFITTREGQLIRIELEADEFGDEFRTATVDRCSSIGKNELQGPACANPVRVSRCEDDL